VHDARSRREQRREHLQLDIGEHLSGEPFGMLGVRPVGGVPRLAVPAHRIHALSIAFGARMRADKGAGMPVEGLMMVTVQVRDFDRALGWYRDVLGLPVLGVEPGEFCVLGVGSGPTTLALATDHPDRIPDRAGVGWAPILRVSAFDAFVDALRSKGVAFDADEEGEDEGYRLVRVRDPEGNVIGIAAA